LILVDLHKVGETPVQFCTSPLPIGKGSAIQGPPEIPANARNEQGSSTFSARATEKRGRVEGRIVKGEERAVDL